MRFFAYSVMETDDREYFDRVCGELGLEYSYTSQSPSAVNAGLAAGCEGIVVSVGTLDRPVLDALHENGVKFIACRSVGVDHVDVRYANSLGMRVSKGAYSPDSVANYAIMLMLMCCRKVETIMLSAYSQNYTVPGKIGLELSECTVGVIGTGKIGLTVLKHLSGFGCGLLAYDVYQNSEAEKYARYVGLDELLRECDIVSLHAPGTPETAHMIDAAAFEKMKRGSIIINTARGDLVDTPALVDALDSGKLFAAGLDVVEGDERTNMQDWTGRVIPNRNLMLLRSYPNVILTNHLASFTTQTLYERTSCPINSLCQFSEGLPNSLEVH